VGCGGSESISSAGQAYVVTSSNPVLSLKQSKALTRAQVQLKLAEKDSEILKLNP
jgi:hypothetical protein